MSRDNRCFCSRLRTEGGMGRGWVRDVYAAGNDSDTIC
jgi:hypothetical protein